MKIVLTIISALFLTSCYIRSTSKLVFPDKTYKQINWTLDERKKEIAIKHLYHNINTSTHLIRLNGSEKPHYHDHHDLNVSILSGKSIIHFENNKVKLSAGDTLFIPMGTLHWAENKGINASIVFAVFSPAYEGKDKRQAK